MSSDPISVDLTEAGANVLRLESENKRLRATVLEMLQYIGTGEQHTLQQLDRWAAEATKETT
jgi:hypothetical protein